jgi:hypothetical protein
MRAARSARQAFVDVIRSELAAAFAAITRTGLAATVRGEAPAVEAASAERARSRRAARPIETSA